MHRRRDARPRGCGVFGGLRTGPAGRPPHLPRPLRPAAPRPGVGGHGGQRRRDDHRRQGHGPRRQRVRRPHARRPRRPPRHRPHPLLAPPARARGATRSRSTATSATHEFALGHNGNLVNTAELADRGGHAARHGHQRQRPRRRAARPPSSRTEPDQSSDGRASERALLEVLPRLEGAFSFVLMDEGHVIGVRDPNGFRPLCLGRLDNGWVLASETPALDVVGAHFVRELEPGEMVVIDATGARSVRPSTRAPDRPEALPLRVRLLRPPRQPPLRPERARGPACAWASSSPSRRPVEADLVMGVPESGIPAAEGYARRSGIPLRPGPREEPLHRPHVHRPQPGDCARSACA